ncbi:MAG: efflux RND transporter periplasmic adaptor subunit [Chlorobi bacterium]|nr:efflux RND transporter periplasmic adaptor subunit [Chlorobiota bacterium]
MMRGKLLLGSFATFLSFLLLSCSETKNGHDKPASDNQDNRVVVLQHQARNIGLKIEPIKWQKVPITISVMGRLELFPQDEALVSPIVSGRISRISVLPGMFVSAGKPLLWLSGPEILNIQKQFAQAYSELQNARAEYDRVKELFKTGAVSERQYQTTETMYHSALARYNSLKQTVELMNLNPENVANGNFKKEISVVSPIDGYIQKIHVNTGMWVNASQPTMTIMRAPRLHADFLVFEKDISKVRKGQKVVFKIPGSSKQYIAYIHATSRSVEEEALALHVHAHIEEMSSELVPGISIEGEIIVAEDSLPTVPESAITYLLGKPIVFVLSNKGSNNLEFIPIPVTILFQNDSLAALKPDSVLTKFSQVAISGVPNLTGIALGEELAEEH